jgi:hypothetical protein
LNELTNYLMSNSFGFFYAEGIQGQVKFLFISLFPK